jgi:hypothetical protein
MISGVSPRAGILAKTETVLKLRRKLFFEPSSKHDAGKSFIQYYKGESASNTQQSRLTHSQKPSHADHNKRNLLCKKIALHCCNLRPRAGIL